MNISYLELWGTLFDCAQLLNTLPDSWVQKMNPPLEKLLQLQRVRTSGVVSARQLSK